ncbi:tail protein [Caulobacter phage CcrPW]|uniref:Gene transfer agent host specificity protein n=1 Tax=Caulobacter phage CcrPW TaxID=2283271 RepID=A0A385ED79_9CAUD|nr:tail protein [Caulobacter phage CcrPW]AXQ68669.1 gene transfer agent host specificity protein [Caulobacter phage CcrPW]
MADPISFAVGTVATMGVSYLFPSEGPRIKDMKISASTYGAQIPNVFGVTRVPGNMIWSNKIRETKRKKMVGKGGFYNQYKYYCTFAMGFCYGPITMLRKLWADGKLIYDASGQSELETKHNYKLNVYTGSEEQYPDPIMEAIVGEGNTPAYRGLCYVVFDDMPLDDFGNRIPQLTAEVFNGEGVIVADGPDVVYQNPEPEENTGDNRPPVLMGYQINQIAVDSFGGYFYVLDKSSVYPVIRQVRISDGQECGRFSFMTPRTDSCYEFSYDSQTIDQIVGVAPGGELLCSISLNNNVAYAMIDLITGNLAVHGTTDPFGGRNCGFGTGTPPGNGSNYHAVSVNSAGQAQLGISGLFGDVSIYDCTSLLAFEGNPQNTPTGHSGFGSFPIVGAIGSTCHFYLPSVASENSNFITINRATRVADQVGFWSAGYIMPYQPQDPDYGYGHIIVRNAVYDATDGGVLVMFTVRKANGLEAYMFGKWSGVTYQQLWVKEVPIEAPGVYPRVGVAHQGQYAFVQPLNSHVPYPTVWIIDTMTGEWKAMSVSEQPSFVTYTDETESEVIVDQSAYTGYPIKDTQFIGYDMQYYDPIRQAVITLGPDGVDKIVKIGPEIGSTTLGAIVRSVLKRGGLSEQHMDMSRLESTHVWGYGWAAATDIKSILEELERVYLFDIVESEGKLVGVMRSAGSDEDFPGSTVVTIKQGALGSTSPEVADFWQETRIQEADLPAKINFTYMNLDADYQPATAYSKRISDPAPTMFSAQQVAIEINIVMKPSEAKTQANRALYAQWAERTMHKTILPWAYLRLDPADIISVEMDDGRSYRERLHHTEIGADFSIQSETYGQDSGAYDIVREGDGGGVPSQPIKAPGTITGFIINTPLLRDQDDTGGSSSRYYSALGNASGDGWRGGELWRAESLPNFDQIDTPINEAEWGYVSGTLPPPRHGHFALDWENKITIWPGVKWFELDSITDDELWAGGNAALVGDEVIQFRDVRENDDGSWTVWNLLRGRRGTEYATHTHKQSEKFLYLLNENSIAPEGEMIDTRGQKRYYKAVAYGRTIAETPLITVDYEPRDLMPYAPKDIRREFSSDGRIEVSWARRTRMGGNMQDYVGEVPVNEAAEKYEVYFYKTPFIGDLSRGGQVQPDYFHSAVVTEPHYSFLPNPAQFASNLDTLTVVVYQISATVGRGFPGTRDIEPWQDF